MRALIVHFTKSKKKFPVFSWIIRGLWGTEYSHTAISFYSPKYDKNLIYQASASGLNFSAESRFHKEHEIVYSKEIEVTEEVHDSIVSDCIDRSGMKYGFAQALGVGLVYIAGKLGVSITNPFPDGRNQWICSEWVALALSKIYPEYNPDLETVSPKEVYDYVKSLPRGIRK